MNGKQEKINPSFMSNNNNNEILLKSVTNVMCLDVADACGIYVNMWRPGKNLSCAAMLMFPFFETVFL